MRIKFGLALVFTLIATAALAQTAAVVAPPGATAAIPQPNGTTVFVYPLIKDLEPYFVLAIGGIITAFGTIGSAFLLAHYNIKVSAADQAKYENIAKNWAGTVIAKGDASVMNATFDASSPAIAAAANGLIAAEPKLVAALGITSESAKTKILGKLGLEQGTSPPTVVPPAK